MQKNNSPAPEGSSVVIPYMIVESIEKEVKFLKHVFGAEITDSANLPDGSMSHCEVRIGDTSIMMGKANEKFPSIQSMIYIYVSDADTAFKKAVDEGASVLMEPEDRFYGNREGGVKDPQGNTWWIAQFLRRVSKEEIEKKMAEMFS